jgi:hypothetical protein
LHEWILNGGFRNHSDGVDGRARHSSGKARRIAANVAKLPELVR